MALKDVDDDAFLKKGWENVDGDFVQAYVESNDNGWTANQVSSYLLRDNATNEVPVLIVTDLGL